MTGRELFNFTTFGLQGNREHLSQLAHRPQFQDREGPESRVDKGSQPTECDNSIQLTFRTLMLVADWSLQ